MTKKQTFENDFPALRDETVSAPTSSDPIFQQSPARGRCRVICFHPRHDLTLARMDVKDIAKVVEAWKEVYVEEAAFLGRDGGYVQIFEVCCLFDPHTGTKSLAI